MTMNGPDFKRVPFVACYSHSGVGAANRNQRGSVIRMLCFNVRPYLWKHGKRGGSDMEAKLRQMHTFWGKDHTCSKHDEFKNRKNKPTRGSDLWYSFQPSHLRRDAACRDYLFLTTKTDVSGLQKVRRHGPDSHTDVEYILAV